MSMQETRRVVEQWYSALAAGDIPGAVAVLSEAVDWYIPDSHPALAWTGRRRGVAETLAAFKSRDALVTVKEFQLRQLMVDGAHAVGLVRELGACKATGAAYDCDITQIFEVRDGKIVSLQSMAETGPIVAAFQEGLPQRLIQAVQGDVVEGVRYLLQIGGNPNQRDAATGLTLLMFAACHANAAMVKLLLEAGADALDVDAATGASVLHKACQGGSVEVARLLVAHGAFIDAVTPTMGHTPVMDALWYSWPDLVEFLTECNADLNLSTHYGFTMMQHYQFELNVNKGNQEKLLAIGRIFTEKQQANQQAIESQTVLAATAQGDTETALQLIESGAEVNTAYPIINSFLDGHTPLLVAARDGRVEIVRALLKAGAKVRVVDWVFKGAPLHKATYNGNLEILKMLVAHPDIDLNVQGPINGYTALHDALWHGYGDCAKVLIDAGARLDLRGHDGKRPLDIAAEVSGADAEITSMIASRMPG